MKNSIFLMILTIIICSCASLNKMTNKAIYYAIVGQNEKVIYDRIGIPTRVVLITEDGKKLIYKFHSRGMVTIPNKSKLTFK